MKHRWLYLAVALGSVLLAACASPLSFDVQSAEAAEMEFTGTIDAVADAVWTIDGRAVAVTAVTEITGSPQVGDVVKVHAYSFPDVGLVAREIEPTLPTPAVSASTVPASDGDEFEFVGPVVTIGSDAWVVGDRQVSITPDTEIKGTPAVGDLVKVHAHVLTDSSLLAREIEPASEDDQINEREHDDGDMDGDPQDGDEQEFRGIVEAIGPTSWTVAGMLFSVDPSTEIKDQIVVGDFVKVEATLAPDGTLTAREIELDDEASDRGKQDDDEDDGHHDDHHDDDHEDDHSGSGSD